MASTLRRCRDFVGGSDIRPHLPDWTETTDVVYLPHSPTGPWGLMKDGRKVSLHGPDLPPEGFDVPDAEAGPDGPFVYFGQVIGHYGHFVCDVLSWAWLVARWTGPPPRLLCHIDGPRAAWDGLDFVQSIIRHLGLRMEDVVSFTRPTRIGRVFVAYPAFGAGQYAHAVFRDLGLKIGTPIWAGCGVDGVERPVYLSKARLMSGITRMTNEAAVEDELARRGVDIVHPETLGFEEQVRLLARRRMILGSAGSALHTTIFAPPGRRILAINPVPKPYSYFPLIDRLSGTEAKYYHPVGVAYGHAPGFEFVWTLRDPRGVARELVARARRFDRLDARDARDDAARLRSPGPARIALSGLARGAARLRSWARGPTGG